MSDYDAREWTESSHPGLYYQEMLTDVARMRSYRRAIDAVVRPGDVVADLGTGLGVLALLAVRAGARLVYAIDHKPAALWLARAIVAANGGAEQVRLIEGDVRTVELEQSVDCIVSELIGTFGTDEGVHASVRGFASRHLVRGGRTLPSRLTSFLVPVEYRGGFRAAFCADNEGLDLRPALEVRMRPGPVIHPLREEARELAAPGVVEDVSFGPEMPERERTRDLDLAVHTGGTLQGFVGYFRATLAPGIELANYPPYPSCHWQHWNWPVSPPLAVAPGDRLLCRLLTSIEAGGATGWTLRWRHLAAPAG